MKRAFTLIELIIIIIIVGIIAVTASTSFKKDTLVPATNQVLDHIRYTQQLAMNQDMFVPAPYFSSYTHSTQKKKDSKQWFKKWWQIQFHKDNSYTIYSDYPSTYDNFYFDGIATYSQNGDTIAKDPLVGKYIAGSSTHVPAEQVIKMVDLAKEYGVNIIMSNDECSSNRIMFDQSGRPHCAKNGSGSNNESIYPYDRIAKNYIKVVLTVKDRDDSSTICVTPITGYAYISENNGCP